MTNPNTAPIAPLIDLPVWVGVCKRGDAKMPSRGYSIKRPATWRDFATAYRHSGKWRGAGINFKAAPHVDAPELRWLVAIDLDKIFTEAGGLTVKAECSAVREVLDMTWDTCPAERSVSGRGAHILAWINPFDLPLPKPGDTARRPCYTHAYGEIMITGGASGRFLWLTCDWLNPHVTLHKHLPATDVERILDVLEPRFDTPTATATDWDAVAGIDPYADEPNRYWDVVAGLPILAEGLAGYVSGSRNPTLHKAAYKARLHGIPRDVFLAGADVAAARRARLPRAELLQVVDNGYQQAAEKEAAREQAITG